MVRTKGERRRGKFISGGFVEVSPFVFTRQQALALGQSKVMAAAKRSFKLIPAIGRAGEVKGLGRFRGEQFIKRGRVFTEKTKFAIDTLGELQQITAKGLSAPRRRAVKKKRKKTKRR